MTNVITGNYINAQLSRNESARNIDLVICLFR